MRASTALLILSVVLFALMTAMLLLLVFVSPHLTYPNAPFPVERDVVPAGSSVVLIVDRCASEPFGEDRLAVTFVRNLTREGTTDRMAIPGGANDIAQGCEPRSLRATMIPHDLAPGRYYLEVTATIHGRFRMATVYARSQTFEVVRP